MNDEPVNRIPSFVTNGSFSGSKMEQVREAKIKIEQAMIKMLDGHAVELEKRALGSAHDLHKFHQMVDTARCLRVTMDWINGPKNG